MRSTKILVILVLLIWAWSPQDAPGCAACFGKSDSRMAQGMNMGIFSLLGVVMLVLSGFGALIVFLARRAVAHPLSLPSETVSESTTQFEDNAKTSGTI